MTHNFTSESSPSRWQRSAISVLQLALFLAAVYFAVRAVIAFLAPESLWSAPPSASLSAAGTNAAASAQLNLRFDSFHRETAPVDDIIEIGTDAPETTLNLKLFGRRAGKDGSAILEAPDKTQKVFRIGEEIMTGVTLKAVHSGYIVLSQGGRIERLTFERENETLLASPKKDSLDNEAEDGFSTPIKTIPKSLTVNSFMAGVNLSPAVSNGQMAGFRITPKNGSVDLTALGLKSGDIVASIGSIDLTAPNLNPAEIGRKLSGQSQVNLKVLRGGDTVFINFGNQ